MAIDCMLLQVCAQIEYISTVVTYKTQIWGLKVFVPSMGSMRVFNNAVCLNYFLHRAHFVNIFHVKNVEKLRKWKNTLGATCKKTPAH